MARHLFFNPLLNPKSNVEFVMQLVLNCKAQKMTNVKMLSRGCVLSRHTALEDAKSSIQTTTSSLLEPLSPLLLGETPSRLSKRGSGTTGHKHSGFPLVNKGCSVSSRRPTSPTFPPAPPSTTATAATTTAPPNPFFYFRILFCLTQYCPILFSIRAEQKE